MEEKIENTGHTSPAGPLSELSLMAILIVGDCSSQEVINKGEEASLHLGITPLRTIP